MSHSYPLTCSVQLKKIKSKSMHDSNKSAQDLGARYYHFSYLILFLLLISSTTNILLSLSLSLSLSLVSVAYAGPWSCLVHRW
jgi:hypothetical protein